jgi:L-asparaginase II
MDTTAALIVETTRGGVVEMESHVSATVTDIHGDAIEIFGNVDRPFPTRSTVKLLQAIPLIESGAADAFSVDPTEIAIACGSHNGEDAHAAVVENWLERLDLDQSDLQCGAAMPIIESIAESYAARGGHPTRARHNCSGKHCGFLTLSSQLGANPTEYLDPCGVVQRMVLSSIEERCRVKLDSGDLVGDGCGSPTACLSLSSLARGWATLLESRPTQGAARILEAITAHPWYLAGTFRYDTRTIEITGGRVITKVGADGLHVAMLRDAGIVVATKALDGSRVAAQVALTELVGRLGGLPLVQVEAIPRPVVTNDSGAPVGEIRVRS